MQRARDGRGRHGERVDVHAQLAQFFFDAYAEFLFLVDDEQPEVVPLHGLADEFVGADEDIDFALFQVGEHGFGLRGGAGAAEVVHAHGEVFEAGGKGFVVLQGEHRGGHEHCHLLVVAGGFEGGADGNLRLAKPNVAAHEAVHRLAAFHIGLHLGSDAELVGSVLVGEAGFQFVLQEGVFAKREALLLLAPGIKPDEVAGDVLNLLLGALLEFFPRARAEVAELRRGTLVALVFAEFVEGVNGDEHGVVVFEGEFDDFLHLAARAGNAHQSYEPPDAVVNVHDEVARLELHEFFERQGHLGVAGVVGAEVVFMETVEDLVVGEEGEAQGLVDKSLVQGFLHGLERIGIDFFKDAFQAVGLLLAVGKNKDAAAREAQVAERFGQQFKVFVEEGLARDLEFHGGSRHTEGVRPDADALQMRQAVQQGVAAREQALALQFAAHLLGLRLAGGLLYDGLPREAFAVDALHLVVNEDEVAYHEAGIIGEVVGEWHQLACRAADVGHDVGSLQTLLRQLGADFEGSD